MKNRILLAKSKADFFWGRKKKNCWACVSPQILENFQTFKIMHLLEVCLKKESL